MDKEIKKGESLNNTNKTEVENITISRFAIIAESKTSVLIKINKTYNIWFNKNWVRCSDYTLKATVGIAKDYEYIATNRKGEKVSFDGSQIIEYFKKEETAKEIDKDLE